MVDKLSEDVIKERLRELPGWSLQDDKLTREFHFANFVDAFGFMTRTAMVAEKSDHHPEWFNVYNRVSIHLMTHDVDGVSDHDFEFAARVNRIL